MSRKPQKIFLFFVEATRYFLREDPDAVLLSSRSRFDFSHPDVQKLLCQLVSKFATDFAACVSCCLSHNKDLGGLVFGYYTDTSETSVFSFSPRFIKNSE